MLTKNILTYIGVMTLFIKAFQEGLISEKEHEEIEIKAAKKCSIAGKSVYRLLITNIK